MPRLAPVAKLIAVAFMATLAFSRSAAADEIYDYTYDLCVHQTSFETTLVDRVVHYLSYASVLPFGPGLQPLEVAHVKGYDIFLSSYKSGLLTLNFKGDEHLRHVITAPSFRHALNDCLPLSRYPNAAKLKAAFVLALLSEQAVGKIAASGTYLGTGAAFGWAAGFLRVLSRPVFNWTFGSVMGVGVVGTSAFVVSKIIQRQSTAQSFPRFTAAVAKDAPEDDIGRAVAADFKILSRAARDGLEARIDEADLELDQVIKQLTTELATTADVGARGDLAEKIRILKLARAVN